MFGYGVIVKSGQIKNDIFKDLCHSVSNLTTDMRCHLYFIYFQFGTTYVILEFELVLELEFGLEFDLVTYFLSTASWKKGGGHSVVKFLSWALFTNFRC